MSGIETIAMHKILFQKEDSKFNLNFVCGCFQLEQEITLKLGQNARWKHSKISILKLSSWVKF